MHRLRRPFYCDELFSFSNNSLLALHLCITPSLLKRIKILINSVCHKSHTSSKKWHKIMRTLQSLGPGVPGGCGLLSVPQKITPCPGNRARISTGATMALRLWRKLFRTMHTQPTHLHELFLHPPMRFGATNACMYALVGVFFNSTRDAFVWKWPLPPSQQQRMKTDKNLQGDINIKALELAAQVLQFILKNTHMNPLKHTLGGVDGTAATG